MPDQDKGPGRDPDTDRVRSRIEGFVPDAVKKLALAGVGALFMTEEGIRNVVGDLKLPREAVGNLLAQSEKARAELFKMIALELRRFLEHANIAGELSKALAGITVDVNATLAFRRNEDGEVVPKVESKTVKTRRGRGRADDVGEVEDG